MYIYIYIPRIIFVTVVAGKQVVANTMAQAGKSSTSARAVSPGASLSIASLNMGIQGSQLRAVVECSELRKLAQTHLPLLRKLLRFDTDIVLLQDCWILHGLWLGKTN